MFMFLDILLMLGAYICELYPWGFIYPKECCPERFKEIIKSSDISMEIENWMVRCFWKMVLSTVEVVRLIRQKPLDLLKSLARYNQEMNVIHIEHEGYWNIGGIPFVEIHFQMRILK